MKRNHFSLTHFLCLDLTVFPYRKIRQMLLCIGLLMTFFSSVYAQNEPPKKHWQLQFGGVNSDAQGNYFGTDWALSVTQTSDGGYISSGFTSLNRGGNPSNPEAAAAIPSITKLTASGKVQWTRNFPAGQPGFYGVLGSVIEVPDGYVAIGRKLTPAQPGQGYQRNYTFLVKVDKEGNTLSQKFISLNPLAIDPAYTSDIGGSIKAIPGGHFIFTGQAGNFPGKIGGFDMFIAELDAQFNIVWSKAYGTSLDDRGFTVDLVWSGGTHPDGTGIGSHIGYILTGTQASNSPSLGDIYIARTDLLGETTCANCWVKVMNSSDPVDFPQSANSIDNPASWYAFDDRGPCGPYLGGANFRNSNDVGRTCIQTEDGNFVLTANCNRFLVQTNFSNPANIIWACDYTDPMGNNIQHHEYLTGDIALIKLEASNGNIIFNKHIGHMSGNDFDPEVVETADNNLVIVGTTANAQLKTGLKQNMILTQTDANGDILWRNVYDYPGVSGGLCGFGVNITDDGGLIVCGNNENDIDNYEFLKLHPQCQPNVDQNQPDDISTPTTISGNVTWNTPRRVFDQVTVGGGATLTITNTTIRFANLTHLNDWNDLAANPATGLVAPRIVVHPTGTLIIDNATLTGLNECGRDFMWEGIQVWGNRNSIPTHQGKVILKNATIEHAKIGVLANHALYNSRGNLAPDKATFGGGTIQSLSGTTFLNCRRSIHFSSYPFSEANAGLTESRVDNTTFLCTAPMVNPNYRYVYKPNDPFGDLVGEPLGNNSFVSLWNTHGVSLRRNTFTNTYPFPEPLSGVGVTSDDASYFLDRGCEVLTQNSCVGAKNIFTGLRYGVRATAWSRVNAVSINGCEFNSCSRSIFLAAVDHARITNNEFDIGLTDPNAYGVYLLNCSDYQVEENSFSATSPHSGMWISNTTPNANTNEIYRNTFSDLGFSTIGEGYNQGSQGPEGLKIRCGTYNNNNFDIASSSPGISLEQGSGADPTSPAGNIFDGCTNSYGEILHLGTGVINYWHHTNSNTIPTSGCFDPNKVLTINSTHSYSPSSCPTHFPASGGSNGGRIMRQGYRGQISAANTQILLLEEALGDEGLDPEDVAAIEAQIGYWEAEKKLAYNGLVREYFYEDSLSQHIDSAIYELEAQATLEAWSRAVDGYLRVGNTAQATTALANLEGVSGWENFYSLKSLQIDWKNADLDCQTLLDNPADLAIVEDIAADTTLTGYMQARAILQFVMGEPIYENLNLPTDPGSRFADGSENIKEEIEGNGLTLNNYPNPFSRSTTITYALPVDGEITLFDLAGRTLMTFPVTAGNDTIYLKEGSLQAGTYFYRLTTTDGRSISKIMIQL